MRPLGDDYEIIAGSRRYQAAKLAGLSEVPVIIRELSDREALMVAVVENLQREDITALDEAQSYARLLDEFNWTQDELARRIGRSRSHISNTLRLLSLPAEVRGLVEAGTLTAGHARALLNAPDPAAIAADRRRARTERARDRSADAPPRQRRAGRVQRRSASRRRAEEIRAIARRAAGPQVRVQATRGGGKLTIYYQAVDELDAALRAYGRQDGAPKASAAAGHRLRR